MTNHLLRQKCRPDQHVRTHPYAERMPWSRMAGPSSQIPSVNVMLTNIAVAIASQATGRSPAQ